MLASASDTDENVKARDNRATNSFFMLRTLAWFGDILKAKIVSFKFVAGQVVEGARRSVPMSLSVSSCLVS